MKCVHARPCVCACPHTPYPVHLLDMLLVVGGCTEAVEGEALQTVIYSHGEHHLTKQSVSQWSSALLSVSPAT